MSLNKAQITRALDLLQTNVPSGEGERHRTRSTGHVQRIAGVCTNWPTQVRKFYNVGAKGSFMGGGEQVN